MHQLYTKRVVSKGKTLKPLKRIFVKQKRNWFLDSRKVWLHWSPVLAFHTLLDSMVKLFGKAVQISERSSKRILFFFFFFFFALLKLPWNIFPRNYRNKHTYYSVFKVALTILWCIIYFRKKSSTWFTE